MIPLTLEATRYNKKLIPATQYANMSNEEKSRFKKTRIAPPKLGSDDFGYIEVTLKIPEYQPV